MPRANFPRTVLEFQKRFANEDACLEYLIASRWPERFVCPRVATPTRGGNRHADSSSARSAAIRHNECACPSFSFGDLVF